MSRLIAALLLILVVRPDALVGQAAAPANQLHPGARIRIATRDGGKARVASVVAQSADTLMVRWPEFVNPVAVPLDEISRLDVSTGRHRHVLKGMLVGTAAMGSLGAILGAATYTPCTSTEFLGCLMAPTSKGQSAAIGGVFFGTLGFLVGSLVGLARQDDWKQVTVDGKRVAFDVRPRAHGAGIGVALEF